MPTPQQDINTIRAYLGAASTPFITLDSFFAARKAVESMTQTPGFLGQGPNPRDFAAASMFETVLTQDRAADAWLATQVAAAKAPMNVYMSQQTGWDRLRKDARPLREVMLDRITDFDAWITTPNDRRGLTPWVNSPKFGAQAVSDCLRNDPNPNVQRKLLTMLVSMPWPTSWTQEFMVNQRLFDDYIERLGASKYDTATRTGLQNLAIRARDAFRRPETFTAMEAMTGGGGDAGGGDAGGGGGGGSSGGPGIAWYRQPTGIGALMAGLAVGVLWGMHR